MDERPKQEDGYRPDGSSVEELLEQINQLKQEAVGGKLDEDKQALTVMKVKVLCSFLVEIEMTEEEYSRRYFVIEDNGCPGTGKVGEKLQEAMDWSEKSGCCWACKLGGQNRIVDASEVCRHVEM